MRATRRTGDRSLKRDRLRQPAVPETLTYCDEGDLWYERHGRAKQILYQVSQTGTVVAGVLGLGPFTAAFQGMSRLMRCAPAAIATRAYALNSVDGRGTRRRHFALMFESLRPERFR